MVAALKWLLLRTIVITFTELQQLFIHTYGDAFVAYGAIRGSQPGIPLLLYVAETHDLPFRQGEGFQPFTFV